MAHCEPANPCLALSFFFIFIFFLESERFSSDSQWRCIAPSGVRAARAASQVRRLEFPRFTSQTSAGRRLENSNFSFINASTIAYRGRSARLSRNTVWNQVSVFLKRNSLHSTMSNAIIFKIHLMSFNFQCFFYWVSTFKKILPLSLLLKFKTAFKVFRHFGSHWIRGEIFFQIIFPTKLQTGKNQRVFGKLCHTRHFSIYFLFHFIFTFLNGQRDITRCPAPAHSIRTRSPFSSLPLYIYYGERLKGGPTQVARPSFPCRSSTSA